MTEFVYPAIFHNNADGSITITYPDLPGCISEGKNIANAMYMAQDALTQWIELLTDTKADIPAASPINNVSVGKNEFKSFIRAEIKDTRAVRRTVSLPKWMDDKAIAENLSLSKVLQESLSARFQ